MSEQVKYIHCPDAVSFSNDDNFNTGLNSKKFVAKFVKPDGTVFNFSQKENGIYGNELSKDIGHSIRVIGKMTLPNNIDNSASCYIVLSLTTVIGAPASAEPMEFRVTNIENNVDVKINNNANPSNIWLKHMHPNIVNGIENYLIQDINTKKWFVVIRIDKNITDFVENKILNWELVIAYMTSHVVKRSNKGVEEYIIEEQE